MEKSIFPQNNLVHKLLGEHWKRVVQFFPFVLTKGSLQQPDSENWNTPILLALIGLFWLGEIRPVLSQGLPPQVPAEQVGMSTDRLQRVDDLLQKHIEQQQIAGAVGLILRHGKTVYLKAVGMSDREAGITMQTDTLFRIASMSKAITSTAIMMLYEEGQLLLTDPISQYIPAFREPKVLVPFKENPQGYTLEPARREIRILDLLTHTSGLSYRFMGQPHLAELYRKAKISDGPVQTQGDIGSQVKRLAELPLLHHPGEAWEYSLATDVLGYLVEVVSGLSLKQFLQQRIFTPLDMPDTHFFIPPKQRQRMAVVYQTTAKGSLERLSEQPIEQGFLRVSVSYPYQGPRSYYSGGSGLVSTASDYARFLQMLLNNGQLGSHRILSPSSVTLMTLNQLGNLEFPTPGFRFGLGFALHSDPGRSGQIGSKGTYSWNGFFYTHYWVDPKKDLISLLMVQHYSNKHLDLHEKFWVTTCQAIIE